MVSDGRQLEAVTGLLGHGTGSVAVDAERASGYRYGQRAYLVQFRRQGAGTVLIDPIACPDLSGVDAALADSEAVLHAAGQDLPCLTEICYRPRRLFDTELAGRLLGYPRVGLGSLVEEVLGLRLEKGHSAADWSTRPLPADWLRYAALDVEVLIELRDALAEQLEAAGKMDWARQEFDAELAAEPPRPRRDPWRRTSGIHRVRTRRSLAVVRELWQTRDRIAQELDLSPGRVLPDSAIIEAAKSEPRTTAELTALGPFTAKPARRYMSDWLRALSRARKQADSALPEAAPPGDGPPPANRWAERDPEAAARLAAARAAVTAIAEEHTLPVENLLQPEAVRRLCWHPPDDLDTETVAAELAKYSARPWQVELTAQSLARALRQLRDKTGS